MERQSRKPPPAPAAAPRGKEPGHPPRPTRARAVRAGARMQRRAHGKTVTATVRSITAALRRMARPAGSFDAARYFRGDDGLAFYNVGTSRVRRLARDLY